MRPEFQPTEEQRRTVEKLASYGVPQAEIARVVRIDPKTLRKHFREQLDTAAIRANGAVAETAYKMAVSGERPTMTMFWLKCRAGWKETQVQEHTGKDGEPIKLRVRITDGEPD
jgi:hypothetical protein